MIALKGSGFDVILISGEPYADHPLSGVGVIARVLDAKGYRVGVIERPDWKGDADFKKLGPPRLFFGLTAGSIDSMLVNYTALKRARSKDEHDPYASGMPDRAVLVYANKVRQLFPGAPIVLGGIEASLRRFAHYDYWENKVRRSLLIDSRSDILVYGPGELQAIEIARRLADKEDLAGILGTCVARKELPPEFAEIPSFEDVGAGPDAFIRAQNAFSNRRPLAQRHDSRYVLQHPMPGYTTGDLDWIYGLPFSRKVPAHFPEFKMAQFSVVTHRGCLGRCSFCSLALHQGDRIVSRSEGSILDEIRRLTKHPDFKGTVDDLGGPTANMYGMDCKSRERCEKNCLGCKRLERSHRRLIELMRKARAVPGVKKVFVRSGIRYDLAMESEEYLRELSEHHLSGLLKIAPEHVSPGVLRLMNKDVPPLEEFRRAFKKANQDRKQHLKYYFMVAHPGSGPNEARELAREVGRLEREGERPAEGVQIFTPTPMTVSTCMYHTGLDPITGAKVHVPRTFAEKKEQKRILSRR
ncbi:MAG: YgiQ family radical SAM protein [Candidatus Aminicenantes bacterium]|nr:YgiQ family radical SAM protein [Candidatus Aminicenantes bacterium]